MAINRAVVQMDTTMFAKITANLFRTEFLLDKIINALYPLGYELSGLMLAFSAFILLLGQIEVVCSIDTVATYFAADSGLMATDVFGDLADGQLACLAGNIVSLF